jgi:hypothetical protein
MAIAATLFYPALPLAAGAMEEELAAPGPTAGGGLGLAPSPVHCFCAPVKL